MDHSSAKLPQVASSPMYCKLVKHTNAQMFVGEDFAVPSNYASWSSFPMTLGCTSAKKAEQNLFNDD